MVADSSRNKTDLIRLLAPLTRLLQDVTRGHDTRRPVVKTGPAEAAALRAPARNLHEEALAHLGARREDDSRRREDLLASQLCGYLQLAAAHRTPEASFLRILCGDCPPDSRGHAF